MNKFYLDKRFWGNAIALDDGRKVCLFWHEFTNKSRRQQSIYVTQKRRSPAFPIVATAGSWQADNAAMMLQRVTVAICDSLQCCKTASPWRPLQRSKRRFQTLEKCWVQALWHYLMPHHCWIWALEHQFEQILVPHGTSRRCKMTSLIHHHLPQCRQPMSPTMTSDLGTQNDIPPSDRKNTIPPNDQQNEGWPEAHKLFCPLWTKPSLLACYHWESNYLPPLHQ